MLFLQLQMNFIIPIIRKMQLCLLNGFNMQLRNLKNLGSAKNKRPILNIVAGGGPAFRPPCSLEERWLSPEYRHDAFKHQLTTKAYIAEGVPNFLTDFGPGCLAACIGGDFMLAPNTVWFENKQLVTDWENPPEIRFNEQSEMWQHIIKQQKYLSADPDMAFTGRSRTRAKSLFCLAVYMSGIWPAPSV